MNGLIIKPKGSLQIDLYADSDFAGLWNAKYHDDPISVKSQSGFLTTLGNVPLIW